MYPTRISKQRTNRHIPQLSREVLNAAVEPLENRLLFSVSASASLALVSTTGAQSSPIYNYDLTVTNTGTTTVGTFWLGWTPGENFLPSHPSGTANPSGWTNSFSGANNSADGTSIEWTASTHDALVETGQSLSGFAFSSTDSPTVLAGDSPTHPGTPALTAVVYEGEPFSDGGFQLVAGEASSTTLTAAATTTTLTLSTASATVGANVSLTATVAASVPGGATPTGTVTFLNNGTSIGTASLGNNGTAVLATTTLPTGTDNITASYGGDSSYQSSSSSAVVETITAAGSAESASAQLGVVSIEGTTSAPVYNYEITVTDTGATTVGTFWFSWLPGQNFLPTAPSSESSPVGWGNGAGTSNLPDVTGPESSPDGTGLRWVAQAGSEIQPGASLAGIDFTSTDSPAVLAGLSPSHPTIAVGTSTIYSGKPFSDAGASLKVAPIASTAEPSLQPSLDSASLPRQIVVGKAFNTTVPITVTNFANTTTRGNSKLTLFASADGELDGSAIPLGSLSPRRLGAHPVSSAISKLRLKKAPANLVAGNYTLIASLTDSKGATLSSTEAASLAVVPATVILNPTITRVTPTTLAAGKTVSVTVVVTNTGNTNSSGALVATFGLSNDGEESIATLTPTQTTKVIKIGPKASTLRYHFHLPVTVTAGSYFATLSLTQDSVDATAVRTFVITVI